ncbi:MAG: OB-fold nucleic acid binding domain-containing protein, partial [Candidatus Nanoarchaeia archaeon]
MAKISGLTAKQGSVSVEGTIVEKGEEKTFNKFGKTLVLVDAILKDDSGTIKLTLWNDDTRKYKEGDKIKVTNGYVNEYQGEKSLTSGKFGKIEKVGDEDTGKEEIS